MRPPTGNSRRVVVVGGGLAGLAAALACADRDARVTVLERRNRLGGLTWSFRHGDRWIDNGQHVFLRCCHEYLSFLDRIGARGDVELPDRLDLPVAAPPTRAGGRPRIGRLRRGALPAPLHLAGSLARYPHIPPADRLAAARAMLALRRLDLEDPALDQESFGTWLARHRQSPASVAALWDLITVPTVNLPAREASLAMAAKVFQTGLLSDAAAGDIGWSRVPLGRLHGERAGVALGRAGVEVRLGVHVRSIEPGEPGQGKPGQGKPGQGEPGHGEPGQDGGRPRFTVTTDDGRLDADAVIVAVPHDAVGSLLPPNAIPHQNRVADLGTSAVIDVHLVFDRRVTDWPILAVLGSPVLWVFDRTSSGQPPVGSGSEPAGSQCVAVSMSAADELLGRRPDDLVGWVTGELGRVLPALPDARLIDSVVTKERTATFRAQPGTGALRPGPATSLPGLAVAGAWTDTGWPATMEGAVRSGRAAAAAVLAGADTTDSLAGADTTHVLAGSDTPDRLAGVKTPDLLAGADTTDRLSGADAGRVASPAGSAPALAVSPSLQPTDTEEVA